jgi:PilZ domain
MPLTNIGKRRYPANMRTSRSTVRVEDRTIIDDRRVAARDRRGSPRIRTLKGAQIVCFNCAPVPCTVRNLSETGANLEVYEPVLQNTFEIVFDLDQSRRSCRVVWRKEPRIGIKFQ